nr:helix-turn-helix domain-containing protein [Shewanella surugensis]
MIPTKTKTSYYRRLYIAYLIDTGVSTVPQIMLETGMPRRTIQDTIKSLSEIDIICVFIGATKDGHYEITHWGAINQKWITNNLQHIITVL